MRVARGAEASHLGDDTSAARQGVLHRLEHERAGALARHEAGAVHIEGT